MYLIGELPVTSLNDIVRGFAYQYYYQGKEIQYDMKNYRRQMYSTPEDATAVRGTYLDCSSFANSVYYNLFGRDLVTVPGYSRVDTYILNYYAQTEWAKGSNKASDVLYYVETADYNNDTDRFALLNEILSQLEVGD